MAIPCFTTIETAVEKVNLFHSNLQIFINHFVIITDEVLTVKIKNNFHILQSRYLFFMLKRAIKTRHLNFRCRVFL